MFRDLTPNSIFWLALGVLLLGGSVYYGYLWKMYPLGLGLVCLAFGSISCGLTNGFNDYSPTGKLLWKLGLPALLLGLLLVGYSLSKFI